MGCCLSNLIGSLKVDGLLDESALNPYELAYLKAKVTRDADSFRLLAKVVVAASPTGFHSTRGIEKLVRNHFGHSISFISVRADLRCRDDQVKAYHRIVSEKMAAINASLKEALEKMLKTR